MVTKCGTGGADMERISKENYYLDIAETVLERATCLRRVNGLNKRYKSSKTAKTSKK